jgi:hypothetical protein
MPKITIENTLSKNLDLYKTQLFRDVVQLVEFAIKDTEIEAKRALNFDANYEVDTRFINITSSFRDKGFTGEVAVDGAKREDGKGGDDMAAYIEFGTGLSAREILAPYPQWVKDIAMQFFVNGLGTLQGKPYLYNNFLKNVEKFKADLKALMDKKTVDK